ncbi:hypothetical protein KUL113_50980 [Tenacibaculum sp. KUL113]|nr:hypothetical protein KUL113_50980 [Tenacibaculum sp. KUL113]
MSESKEVAEWMLEQFVNRTLYQQDVVYKIQEKFGDDFVYTNNSGGLSIDKGVLNQFRKLTEGKVQWSRGDKAWIMAKDGETFDSRQNN